MSTSNVTMTSLGGAFLSHSAVFGVRMMFYAVLPSETSYKTPEEVPHYVNKATPFFLSFLAVEALVLYLRGKKKRMLRWNDALSSIGAGLVSELPHLLVRNIEMSSYLWVYEHWRVMELPWDSPSTWWLCMLGVDLGYYWVHRCAHEINFMWAGHQMHHSSQHYNLSTALRQGVFQRYSSWVFYLPLALFIPPAIFIAHIQFNLLYQFWIHTEIIDRLGPLEYILNTPSHHRVHHGVNRYCIDKNYAGVLIIWDRIFGTFEPEDRKDEVVYGLTHQINTWDPVRAQTCHWKHILSTVYHMPGLSNKLSVLLKGPGWQPGKPRLGCIEDIPDAHAPATLYNSTVTGVLNVYTVIQFILALILHETLIKNHKSMDTWTLLILILFIIWTLSNIGYFYDNKPYAAMSELVRCAVILSVDYYLFSSRQMTPVVLPGLRFSAVTGLLVCLFSMIRPRHKDVDSKTD